MELLEYTTTFNVPGAIRICVERKIWGKIPRKSFTIFFWCISDARKECVKVCLGWRLGQVKAKLDTILSFYPQVKNFIPSISAITGAEPQRYVWRTCIALHSTPRFAVGVIYYNYWLQLIHNIAEQKHTIFRRLVSVTFWTYTVENACLVLVSFIGNFENYRE